MAAAGDWSLEWRLGSGIGDTISSHHHRQHSEHHTYKHWTQLPHNIYLPNTNNSVEISHETAVLCDLKSLILQFLYVPVQTNICTIRFTNKQKFKYEGSISILFGSNSNIVFHEPFSCVWPRRGEWSSELET